MAGLRFASLGLRDTQARQLLTALLRATAPTSPTKYRNLYRPGAVGALSVNTPEAAPHRRSYQRSECPLAAPVSSGSPTLYIPRSNPPTPNFARSAIEFHCQLASRRDKAPTGSDRKRLDEDEVKPPVSVPLDRPS